MRTGTDAMVVRMGWERCSTIHESRLTWCVARTNCWCAISASEGGPAPSGVGAVMPRLGVWVSAAASCFSSGDTGAPILWMRPQARSRYLRFSPDAHGVTAIPASAVARGLAPSVVRGVAGLHGDEDARAGGR